jgi:hypothetical protein
MENFINYLNSINYEYQKPAKLFGDQNNKTIKGLKKGYKTLIIYLSPEKQNSLGKNLCPKASEGCKKACLFTAGRGHMPNVINARIRKTEYFLKDRASFMVQAAKEIKAAIKKEIKLKDKGKNLAIRMNGTSDIPFENIPLTFEGKDYKNIMEIFPDIQFYDYTKIYSRLLKELPKNYDLTFSRSENETNHIECIQALGKGFRVASVFRIKGASELANIMDNFKVVDGDETDLTFLHPKGVILGLKAKGRARKEKTGFVIDLN